MSTEKQEIKLPTKQVLTFKQNLKKYRKLAYKDGLTFCKSVDSFADHVGINKVTYTAYEAERRSNVPDYDTLVAIAAALILYKAKEFDRNLKQVEKTLSFFKTE